MDNYFIEQSIQEESDPALLPCKSLLCVICVSSIPPPNSDPLEDGDRDQDVTISKETFLKGIAILCKNLNLQDTFGREEGWTQVLGTRGNFVESVCCARCFQLLRSLVELHELIKKLKNKLKERVNQVELTVVNSFGLAEAEEAEYSISTCLKFREEVFKSFQSRRNGVQKIDPDVPLSRGRKRSSGVACPLSVKRRMLDAKLKKEALTRQPEVKLERLSLLLLGSAGSSFESPILFEDEGGNPQVTAPADFEFEGYEDTETENLNLNLKVSQRRSSRAVRTGKKKNQEPKPSKPRRKRLGKRKQKESRLRKEKPTRLRKQKLSDEIINKLVTNFKKKEIISPEVPNIEKLLCEHCPQYCRPYLVIDDSKGILSFACCKIILEYDRLICKHPDCGYDIKLRNFPISQYYALRTMRLHVSLEHRKERRVISGRIEEVTKKQYFHCPYCDCTGDSDNQFEKRSSLFEHIIAEHPNAESYPSLCEVCGCTVPHAELMNHVITHKGVKEIEALGDTSVLCKSLSLPRRGGLKKNLFLSLEFPCDGCDQVFEEFYRYQAHAMTHVPIELRKQFQCDQCPEKFVSKDSLKMHLLTHLPEDPRMRFECSICGQKFKELRCHEAHMMRHTGELPFQCAKCGKKFRGIRCLRRHDRIWHSETGTKLSFQCELCPKVYGRKNYLRTHQRNHHPEYAAQKKCKNTGRQLEFHPDYHGPKLMFPCEPCENVFSRKSLLVHHFRRSHKWFLSENSDYPDRILLEDKDYYQTIWPRVHTRKRLPKPKPPLENS